MKQCNELFPGLDNCSMIVLLVGGYFFLANGCIDNIFGNCENSIVWIIILFWLLFMYNKENACC